MAMLQDDLCSHYLNLEFSDNFISADCAQQHYIDLPHPVHKPFNKADTDPLEEYQTNLQEYRQKLVTLEKEFGWSSEQVMNQDFQASHVQVTKGILDFCNIEKCEAPFTCDYNPYYATGTLETVDINKQMCLVRPNLDNQICVTTVVDNPAKTYKLKVEKDLQTTYAISHVSNNSILLRHKNSVNLLKINNLQDECEIKYDKKFKIRLLDAKMSDSRLACVFHDLKFSLFDTKTDRKLRLGRFNIKDTTRVDFIDENNLAVLNNHKCLKIFDCRSRDHRLFEPNLDSCNTLINFKICDDNTVYLATRHFLIRTDARFFNNVEFCSHLLRFSPCFLEQNDNFLVLSSQKFDGKVVFSGHPVNSLPLNVPNLNDSLTKCRLSKDVLLKDGLDERIRVSTVGIKLLKNKNGSVLYSANALGEIFKQNISDCDQSDADNSIVKLYDWINTFPEPPRILRVTNLANASHIRFVLNKRIQDEKLRKFERKGKKCSLFLNHYNNVYNKKNLGDLGANFASIWDDEEEKQEEIDLAPEVAPIDKVTSWMESSSYFL